MKTVYKLSLLAMAMTLVGCNEKVSPELEQSSNVTTPDNTIITPPDEFYFKISDASPTMLNYKLHKTGSGNASTPCEVRNTTGFSNDIFRGNPAANDISCYFDAEELSLYHTGFSVAIEASKNSCEYIGYGPFGFFDRIPGDSSSRFIQVTCASDTTANTHVTAQAGARGLNITDSSGSDVGCGDWISQDIVATDRESFVPTTDAELCRFNYPDAEQCDIGRITVNELVVTHTPGVAPAPDITKSEIVPRIITCGGAVANCVKGPVKAIASNLTKVIEITKTETNANFTKTYAYDTLIGKAGSTKFYSNYRRNLASSQINFVSSDGLDTYYRNIWNNATYGRIFEPRVMDFFSSNLLLNNTTQIIDSARLGQEAIRNNKWKAKPLAADPYLGLGLKVNPFYTFYCYDTNLDMKARVRMVLRDWDRVAPNNSTDLELLSDLHNLQNARQDAAPEYVELENDNDPTIALNDFEDWDDHIPMERTPGSLNLNSTIWSPTPTADYLDGWFNPAIFTNGGY